MHGVRAGKLYHSLEKKGAGIRNNTPRIPSCPNSTEKKVTVLSGASDGEGSRAKDW